MKNGYHLLLKQLDKDKSIQNLCDLNQNLIKKSEVRRENAIVLKGHQELRITMIYFYSKRI
jgi:hypothetical protein